MSISTLLSKITGRYVETTGWAAGAVVNSIFFHNASGIAIGALLLFYILTRKRPQTFNFLQNFAEPTTWPSYVTLGVVIILGAFHGGWAGLALAGAMLMMNDGRTFDSLY